MWVKAVDRSDTNSVKLMLRNLPAILSGRTGSHARLREAFLGAFSRRMFELVSDAYLSKAQGDRDSLGNRWRPLKKSTVRWRKSPKVSQRYPQSKLLKIMRLSDRLFRSISPGFFNGSFYSPRNDQLARFQSGLIELGSLVPYADNQAKHRPIFPANMAPWLADAARHGLEAATKLLLEQV